MSSVSLITVEDAKKSTPKRCKSVVPGSFLVFFVFRRTSRAGSNPSTHLVFQLATCFWRGTQGIKLCATSRNVGKRPLLSASPNATFTSITSRVETWKGASIGQSQLHTPVPLAHHASHKKNRNHFFPKNDSKISKINSNINFIQKYPRNYCSISSQIAYKWFLCFFVKMCFAKLHFLTVHLQTSHSISIWLYAFL